MKTDPENDVLIDRYLRGELPIQERTEFEALLEAQPELAAEVEERYDLMVGIRAAERERLRQHLEELDKPSTAKVIDGNEPEASTPQHVRALWLTVLAGLLILLLIWYFVFYS